MVVWATPSLSGLDYGKTIMHRVASVGVAVIVAVSLSVPVQAQVLIQGRVEDALALTPLAGARVVAPDTTAIFTDSLGAFSIRLPDRETLYVEVTQYGYLSQRFYLPPEARSRTSVLRLEPIVIELEAIEVVGESAVQELLTGLRRRRNAYAGGVQAFDKVRLDELARVGTVWDFVTSRARNLHECDLFDVPDGPEPLPTAGARVLQLWTDFRSGVCVAGRASLNNPSPEIGVMICVDGWESWGAISELESLDIRSVALVEIYGRGIGGIRVYTSRYLLSMASRGRTISTPLTFGC
jgi:hypothetical protein